VKGHDQSMKASMAEMDHGYVFIKCSSAGIKP